MFVSPVFRREQKDLLSVMGLKGTKVLCLVEMKYTLIAQYWFVQVRSNCIAFIKLNLN